MELSGCPTCGERRTGAFRFCRGCGFDFDEAASITVDDVGQDATSVPFDLFPTDTSDASAESSVGVWSRGGIGTGILLIAGILGAFLVLLYFRPLG